MSSQTELPKYTCHKQVRAAKITAFAGLTLILGEINAEVEKDINWHTKHAPKIGGYYIIYPDGYSSYSPAEPFEEGYTKN